MTKEEALEWFRDRKKMNLDDKCQQAEDMAIKALEQEPVIDKIRAEIERQEKWITIAGINAYNVDIALNAIKSAVAESEDNDSR